jgi:hypothetical protein
MSKSYKENTKVALKAHCSGRLFVMDGVRSNLKLLGAIRKTWRDSNNGRVDSSCSVLNDNYSVDLRVRGGSIKFMLRFERTEYMRRVRPNEVQQVAEAYVRAVDTIKDQIMGAKNVRRIQIEFCHMILTKTTSPIAWPGWMARFRETIPGIKEHDLLYGTLRTAAFITFRAIDGNTQKFIGFAEVPAEATTFWDICEAMKAEGGGIIPGNTPRPYAAQLHLMQSKQPFLPGYTAETLFLGGKPVDLFDEFRGKVVPFDMYILATEDFLVK